MAKAVLEIPPELEEMAERVGEFIQYWGFKKIHGKIWTHLYLSEKPLDAQDLIKRLGVSKALMSFSLNDLQEYQVILEAGKSDRNTQLFVANPDVLAVILNVLRRREKRMLAQIYSSYKMLSEIESREKQSIHICEDRLAALGNMINQAQTTLSGVISLEELQMGLWKDLFSESEEDSIS